MIDPRINSRFHPAHALEIWHPEGVLDIDMATVMVHYMDFVEAIADAPFNRFSDLTQLTAIHLDFKEVAELVAYRRACYGDGPPVKSALLAANRPNYGVAMMFAALMETSPIDVRVFRTAQDAADWLGVPVEVLEKGTGLSR